MLVRKKEDKVGEFAEMIKEGLLKSGNYVDIFFREDDLNMLDLSSSMNGLKEFVRKKDENKNYDKIITFDWSIAFPFVFPIKILKEKHFCFFYDLENSGGKSKVLQKITANMLGDHLISRTYEIKEKFPKSKLFEKDMNDLLK